MTRSAPRAATATYGRAGKTKAVTAREPRFEAEADAGRRILGEAVPADHVRLKRAYLPADPEDGTRVLVDRLWPRGVSKAGAALAFWNRDVSPIYRVATMVRA